MNDLLDKHDGEVLEDTTNESSKMSSTIEKKLKELAFKADQERLIKILLKLNDVLEKHRSPGNKGKREQLKKDIGVDVNPQKVKYYSEITKGKNVVQSLIYLILNEDFYSEILTTREKLEIPKLGCRDKDNFENWVRSYSRSFGSNKRVIAREKAILKLCKKEKKSKSIIKSGIEELEWLEEGANIALSRHGYKTITNESKRIVKKFKLAYRKDIEKLSRFIYLFLTYRVDFKTIFEVLASSVLKMPDSYYAVGFDIKVDEQKDTKNSFYTYQWKLDLFPFTNMTGTLGKIKNFFKRELITNYNMQDCDPSFIKLCIKKQKINKGKAKAKEGLKIINKDDYVQLRFITNFFTGPNDISRLYKNEYPRIKKLLREKEDKIREIQKKGLSERMRRSYNFYKMHRKGMNNEEIFYAFCVFNYNSDGYKESGDGTCKDYFETYYRIIKKEDQHEDDGQHRDIIKKGIIEFKKNIKLAINRKIIF